MIRKNLESHPHATEEEKIQIIADTLFGYSYDRKHGGFETLSLRHIRTGDYGFNCEMSSAMLNEALQRQGYQPRVIEDKDHFRIGGEHYMSCLIGEDGTAKIIDLYKYGDLQTHAQIHETTLRQLAKNGGDIVEGENRKGDRKQFYLYPEGIKYDALQSLKNIDSLKTIVQTEEPTDMPSDSRMNASNVIKRYPGVVQFDLAELQSKLHIVDPERLFSLAA